MQTFADRDEQFSPEATDAAAVERQDTHLPVAPDRHLLRALGNQALQPPGLLAFQLAPGPGQIPPSTGGPGPTPPSTSGPAVAAPDPDTNEATFRAQRPDLAQIDRTQPPQTNEDAVRAVVVEAFGSEEAVEAAFNALAPEVRQQVNTYVPKDQRSDTAVLAANHVQFFVRMRLYFDSWADLLEHFSPSNIVRVSDGPVDVWLHQDAAERLKRVIRVMKNHNHPLPSIGEGFSLRGFHIGPFKHHGYMVHALGYAVDIAARTNPKIFTPPEHGDAGRHDPVQIATSVGQEAMSIPMRGEQDAEVVKAMGTRTAGDASLSAADDTDRAARDYFQRFEQGFQQMRQGSSAFITALGPLQRAALLLLRNRYFEILTSIKAEKAKGPRADKKVLEGLAAQQRTALSLIPLLTTEWVRVVDADIAKTLGKHPGMERLHLPAELRHDIAQVDIAIGKARQEAAHAAVTKARADAASDAAEAAAKRALDREHRTPAGPQHDKARAEREAAWKHWFDALDARTAAIDADSKARQAVKARAGERGTLAAELKESDSRGIQAARDWLDKLRYLGRLLTAPDLDTPAGLREFESVTTGDLSRKAPVENPPLLRLLDAGFFNPTGAFDLAFFEEMAHSGFWPGATWSPGSADPMHFELYEGRKKIREPGKF